MNVVAEVAVQHAIGNGGGANAMVIDVDEVPEQTPSQHAKGTVENEKGSGGRKKYTKRKRSVIDEKKDGSLEGKEVVVARCRQEIDELRRCFRESLVPRLDMEDGGGVGGSSQAMVACMMEGSGLPASKLAEEIQGRLNGREGITAQSLQADLTFLGSRVRYGLENVSSGLGDDESELCLWCWEVRDITSLPKSQRGFVKCLRKARKKVHDRIDVLSATIGAISKSDSQDSYKSVLSKASERLRQESSVVEILLMVEKFIEKRNANMVLKEIKIKVDPVNVPEENKQDVENQKKRKDKGSLKEKTEREKELKRLKEADKEERQREKEEVELKKLLKKQQGEADREQKRREKEEALSKKQASLRKQAIIMERFLTIKRNSNTVNDDIKSSMKEATPLSSKENVVTNRTVTSSMDHAFCHSGSFSTEDLCKSHFVAWYRCRYLNRLQHWGIRCKPKIELLKEIKLHESSFALRPSEDVDSPNRECISSQGVKCGDLGRVPDEQEKNVVDGPSGSNDIGTAPISSQLPSRTKKLLQFDKSNRPAYYGTWSKKSGTVGPRRPLQKDPDLDYDIDSDEEWEEEEPGESLTDCDQDDEEIDDIKANSDVDSEDGFFVPDGYLSDNEGAQVDASSSDEMDDEARSLSNCPTEVESEEFRLLLQQMKDLHRLTEKALLRSQPLIISNLMHEKSTQLLVGDVTGMTKIEEVCLRALCIQACPVGPVIEISVDNLEDVDEGICQSQCKSDASPVSVSSPLLDSHLPEIVKTIQSCPHGMSKVVELLRQKFPAMSKSQLKNKVKEISVFVDNHWKVKTEVLDKLGLSPSPEKSKKPPKGIATFFSKRCLPQPPTAEPINIPEASPSPLKKIGTISDDSVHGCCPESVGV